MVIVGLLNGVYNTRVLKASLVQAMMNSGGVWDSQQISPSLKTTLSPEGLQAPEISCGLYV